jgi:hypothetical protein
MHRGPLFSQIRQQEKLRFVILIGGFFAISGATVFAGSRHGDNDFVKYAMKLRENALRKVTPKVIMAPTPFSGPGCESALSLSGPGGYPWKRNITTTVFWVGELAAENNPVPNDKSAWDSQWCSSYGGYDTPNSAARRNFLPISFSPRQNPFYVALPYNDVDDHHTKPEAAKVIPWFKNSFVQDGRSVCKGRWIAIRHGAKVCYAQWEDVGPFRTDDWQYVFGKEFPKPNRNQSAGLDVSPAVRDYLGLGGKDVCNWKFVDYPYVPPGPWARHGGKHSFVGLRGQSPTSLASRAQ